MLISEIGWHTFIGVNQCLVKWHNGDFINTNKTASRGSRLMLGKWHGFGGLELVNFDPPFFIV